MTGLPTAKCSICGAFRFEGKRWLVAIKSPDLDGVIFQRAETVEAPSKPAFTYDYICGQLCAHKRFSGWLDEVNELFTQPTEESVTA